MTELLYCDDGFSLAEPVARARDRLLGPRPVLIVGDGTIAAAEGGVLGRLTAALGPTTRLLVLPGEPPPKADDRLVKLIRLKLDVGGYSALAFGAGTINDAASGPRSSSAGRTSASRLRRPSTALRPLERL